MEIRFPADSETPHYLQEIAFSKSGENVVIQVVSDRNTEKARYVVDRTAFVQAMRALGVSTRPVE